MDQNLAASASSRPHGLQWHPALEANGGTWSNAGLAETEGAAHPRILGLLYSAQQAADSTSRLPYESASQLGESRRALSDDQEEPDVRRTARAAPPPPKKNICSYGDPFAKAQYGGCCEVCKKAGKKYSHYKDSDLDSSTPVPSRFCVCRCCSRRHCFAVATVRLRLLAPTLVVVVLVVIVLLPSL